MCDECKRPGVDVGKADALLGSERYHPNHVGDVAKTPRHIAEGSAGQNVSTHMGAAQGGLGSGFAGAALVQGGLAQLTQNQKAVRRWDEPAAYELKRAEATVADLRQLKEEHAGQAEEYITKLICDILPPVTANEVAKHVLQNGFRIRPWLV